MTVAAILFGLFGTAFLAATVIPMSSEAALSAALLSGVSPTLALFFATLGNALGSATTYVLGRLGRIDWLNRFCRMKPDAIVRLRQRAARLGPWAAFGCFLPVIGDGFAVGLGFFRYSWWRFLLLMTLGKLVRYAVWFALHWMIRQTTGS